MNQVVCQFSTQFNGPIVACLLFFFTTKRDIRLQLFIILAIEEAHSFLAIIQILTETREFLYILTTRFYTTIFS